MTILGQDAQISAFLGAAQSGRMHHGWLLTGPEGVGKASFARAAALRLLAEAAGPHPGGVGLDVRSDHRIAALIDAGSHADFLWLAREVRDEKTGALARNISVDQVRKLGTRFALSPSHSDRRVVVIDAVDDLERGAANALLKNLEEPPAGTIFLLVSHAPGRLLPTIRSRCRVLRFGLLDGDAMTSVLRGHMPDAHHEELAALVKAGAGSPGKALGFAGLDIGGIERVLRDLAANGDPTNATRSALAQKLATKAAQPRFEAFLDCVPSFIAGAARTRQGAALADGIKLWERAQSLVAVASTQNLDPQSAVFELAGYVAALAPGASSAKA
jgi:DNA polymerase III subunit delta'